jgi:23S rRNA (cytidine2498-2'-O)-methyltransferase
MSGRVMFSFAENSFDATLAELRAAFGQDLTTERLGPDVAVIAGPVPGVAEVFDACTREPMVFVRHLTCELARISPSEAAEINVVADTIRSIAPPVRDLALQVWLSGSSPLGYGASELYAAASARLIDSGYAVFRAGRRDVVSACLSPSGVSIGLNRAATSISDWPGGRVRLSRPAAQVSRAEFKLEELFQAIEIALPGTGRAVDLGASPGGWTRLLRQRGLEVWAIDPSELDPRVSSDRRVHHVRTTAGEFFRHNPRTFDLAVNDMRMEPMLSCKMMIEAARHLRPGGLAIVTLKLGGQHPVKTVRQCLEVIASAYDLVFARQLHHNRQEVTVVGRRRRG